MDTPAATSITTDHDILIEVRTTLNTMQQSVNAVTQDHEIRIRKLEGNDEKRAGAQDQTRWQWGILALLATAVITQWIQTGKI